jgi:hypothetical protein
MYGRLAYNFEGLTDMINVAFMEDLSDLLNSITGDQRRCKTSYEIDTEFEKMTTSQGRGEETWGPLRPAELGWRRSSAPSVRPSRRTSLQLRARCILSRVHSYVRSADMISNKVSVFDWLRVREERKRQVGACSAFASPTGCVRPRSPTDACVFPAQATV